MDCRIVFGMVYTPLVIRLSCTKKRKTPSQKEVNKLLNLVQNLLSKICANLVEFLKT